VRSRARELIPERQPRPGRNYALTEVVRCKSRNERGVEEARLICSGRYLERTLDASRADVVVFLGMRAEVTARAILNVPREVGIRGHTHVTKLRPRQEREARRVPSSPELPRSPHRAGVLDAR
jgi:uracil-DNA glycosylase